jgi:N-acetylmuramoyl-L-alanine amidase
VRWLHAAAALLLYTWLAGGLFGAAFYFFSHPAKGAEVLQLHKGDLDLLGRVIWAEARSEPFEGQCAIAWIILNRLAREQGRFPDTIQGIIKQPFAFSCFNSNDPQCERVKTVTEQDASFVEAMHAATAVLTGRVKNPIGPADHYFLTKMRDPPAWARKMTLVKRIGGHSFFSERPVP